MLTRIDGYTDFKMSIGSPTEIMQEDIGTLADDNANLQTHNPSRDSVTVDRALSSDEFVPDLANADGAESTPHRLVGPVQYSTDLPIADAAKFSFESERDYVKRLSSQSGMTISPSRSSQASIVESARGTHTFSYFSSHSYTFRLLNPSPECGNSPLVHLSEETHAKRGILLGILPYRSMIALEGNRMLTPELNSAATENPTQQYPCSSAAALALIAKQP